MQKKENHATVLYGVLVSAGAHHIKSMKRGETRRLRQFACAFDREYPDLGMPVSKLTEYQQITFEGASLFIP